MKSPLEALQPLGRALMLPIAVLPVAGLLLRLGQPDLLNIPFMAAAGDAVFSNLGLLFAIGVAVGFARDNNGAAGLAGVVCYLISVEGAQALMTVPPEALKDFTGPAVDLASAAFKDKATGKLSVPIGIVSGLLAGAAYNRFHDFKLPDYLAFFGGRRFVPIVSGVGGLLIALIVGLGFPGLDHGFDALSRGIVASGEIGLFVYGVLNRLLIVTGLHHILNNIAWFVVGEYGGATGDLRRFFAGDPSAGAFMSGFFPVMMFGLPAACLAMYHSARPDRRKAVGGMLLSMSATAFLTGVTEPIEFTFMFLAPLLYALHAVLTGAAMVLMDVLGVKLGFGFSAGAIDYVLNFNKSTRPLMLIPIGLVYFAIYYGVFRFVITRFNLRTPGREAEDAPVAAVVLASGGRGEQFAAALGGAENLVTVDACTTRLRLVVADQARVDEAALKSLGSRGLVRPSANALQVVLGPIADQVAGEIRAAAAASGSAASSEPQEKPGPAAAGAPAALDRLAWLAAFGGAGNVRRLQAVAGRLRLEVADATAVREDALLDLGARAVVHLDGSVHVLLENADGVAAALA
ncbi:N-acetylglucosamine-specific PTS transporter subunit IIBC [Caulobacter mirabilis]|uniref:PTS N-acetyl-D-glucosamine transporter n=1 Tax=Caulobacter mirabilis TaxID=69666 RepID=A0A2D2B1K1_9CAUL|nr:N-acetylglucosamine-specific PTS transporter subunit IIBC [Caulobacter mirabilis]ATQ44125.1 PTS N-acetyl-D-glucosamine transporter [Caulobacter mirabilis]